MRPRRGAFLGALVVAAVACAGMPGPVGPARADSAREALEAGNRAFQRGQFEDALAAYREGVLKFPAVAELHQGAGNALYRLKRYAEASREYQEAVRATDPRLRAAGHYNQGDAEVRANQLPQSLENYKEALRQHPEDPDAKFNYELVRARLEDSQKQQQQQGQGGGVPERKQPDQGGDRPKQQPGGQQGKQQGRAFSDPQQLTREQAEQLLRALASEEQRVQSDRLKARPSRHRRGKDW